MPFYSFSPLSEVPALLLYSLTLNSSIDPRGRLTVTVINTIFARKVCASVLTFQNLAKQNKFQVKIGITSVGTVGLAEWIIDGTHVLFYVCLVGFPVSFIAEQFHVELELKFFITILYFIYCIHLFFNSKINQPFNLLIPYMYATSLQSQHTFFHHCVDLQPNLMIRDSRKRKRYQWEKALLTFERTEWCTKDNENSYSFKYLSRKILKSKDGKNSSRPFFFLLIPHTSM